MTCQEYNLEKDKPLSTHRRPYKALPLEPVLSVWWL